MASDAVFFLAPHTLRLVCVNRAACASLGYTHDEMLEMHLHDIAPASREGRLANAVELVVRGNAWDEKLQSMHRRKCGAEFPVEMTLRRIGDASAAYLVMVASDTRRRAHATNGSAGHQRRDELTGLPTRASLWQRLEQQLGCTQHSSDRFAVLFADIDNFKCVNDTLGHLVGDHVLRTVARRLTVCLRPTDIAVRYGGDEFVALVADVNTEDDVIGVARRIQSAMGEDIVIGKKRVRVSASIGIALGHRSSTSADQLIQAADAAMYRAKERGRRGLYAINHLAPARSGGFAGEDDSLPEDRLSDRWEEDESVASLAARTPK